MKHQEPLRIGLIYGNAADTYKKYLENLILEIKKSNNISIEIPLHKPENILKCDAVYMFPHSILLKD